MPPMPVFVGTLHAMERESAVYPMRVIEEGAKGNIAASRVIGSDGSPKPREFLARTLS